MGIKKKCSTFLSCKWYIGSYEVFSIHVMLGDLDVYGVELQVCRRGSKGLCGDDGASCDYSDVGGVLYDIGVFADGVVFAVFA